MALNCPTCGKFAKIVNVQDDSAPMSAEISSVATVECKDCGLGEQS